MLDIYFLFQLIPYIILLLLCVLIPIVFKREFSPLLLFLLFFSFSAFRYDVGWDWMEYHEIVKFDIADKIEGFELIERYIIYFCQWLNVPDLFFVINSFFTFLFLYLGIRKLSINPRVSFLIYLCIPVLYLHGLSTVRFHLALSVIFWAFSFLQNRKLILFLLIVIIAYFIHASSLVALLFIPLYYINVDRKFNIIILVSSFLISTSLFALIQSIDSNIFILAKLLSYSNVNDGGPSPSFTVFPILFHAINILNLIFYKKIVSYDGRLSIYATIFNISCCIMQIFSFDETLSARLSRYFFIFIILIFPYYLLPSKYRQINHFIIYSFLIGVFFMQFVISASAFKRKVALKDQFLPYKTFFFEK